MQCRASHACRHLIVRFKYCTGYLNIPPGVNRTLDELIFASMHSIPRGTCHPVRNMLCEFQEPRIDLLQSPYAVRLFINSTRALHCVETGSISTS